MMRHAARHLAVLLILSVALAGATCQKQITPETAKIKAGKVIEAAAKQFISTAKMYDRLFDEKLITADEYRLWAEFVPRFQKAFGTAYTTWVLMPDDATSFNAEQFTEVVDELVIYYLKARKKPGARLDPVGPRLAESGGGE